MRLCEPISVLGSEALDARYDSQQFHAGTYRLTLRDAEGRVLQEIFESGDCGPSALFAVKCAVEAIRNRLDWRPVPPSEDAGAAGER